jgi:hypothetical protein
MTALQVRPARPDEYAALGELTVAAYAAVDPGVLESDYADELRDVAGRAAGADVLGGGGRRGGRGGRRRGHLRT